MEASSRLSLTPPAAPPYVGRSEHLTMAEIRMKTQMLNAAQGCGDGMPLKRLNRRDFVALLGAAAWPLAARAEPAIPVIGYLAGPTADAVSGTTAAFRQGLAAAGYVEGRNVAIEYRWAEFHYDRLPALAADLVHREVAAIATIDTASALAAKAATAIIPVVFAMGADPIRIGLVDDLARPGGNVTGMSYLSNALSSKRLGLLHELVPSATTFGLLVDPTNPNTEFETADMKAAVNLIGCKLAVAGASTASELDTAFAKLLEQHIEALVVAGQGFFLGDRVTQLAKLSLSYRVPTMYAFRVSESDGGALISYDADPLGAYRQAGVYTARILRGAKPSELPVQTPVKFDLVINLRTANALGLTIPPDLLAIADELIE
jgi:putative ABC transport system substrate-binding protein